MVLDRDSINKHLELLRRYVSDLIDFSQTISLEELQDERKKQYMVLYPITMAIQSCVDIANHIIAERSFRRPEENTEVFKILAEKGILEVDFANELKNMVKFRNLAIHLYWKVDMEKVFDILKSHLDDFSKFEKYIVEYIEKER